MYNKLCVSQLYESVSWKTSRNLFCKEIIEKRQLLEKSELILSENAVFVWGQATSEWLYVRKNTKPPIT